MRTILFLSLFVILTVGVAQAGGDELQWFYTCGDPSCHGYTPSGAPLCTTEVAGDPCETPDEMCDPQDDCNAQLICSDRDPRSQPGGCPISSRKFKLGVSYLDEADLQCLAEDVQKIRLATYRYKDPADGNRPHLGFIIEDNPNSAAVMTEKDQIDLYGYTSMVVAALQAQSKEMDRLKAEVQALRQELDNLKK
ncbi:MAG: tail fiber domain-containing protein [Acidobacteria bacterium]|nr:tail fiber domain-containing protein [Acidobacteriota bacterium]MBI3655422.1 tail fiber domain-containing protein [Acidobacteriota bacterium]